MVEPMGVRAAGSRWHFLCSFYLGGVVSCPRAHNGAIPLETEGPCSCWSQQLPCGILQLFRDVFLSDVVSDSGPHKRIDCGVCMSSGSLFAGWMMHRTGKYKLINLIFGFFPFIGISLITLMREDSGPLQMWLSIIPFGFGNAIVFQTTLVALLAHLPEGSMAVGTGFGQLFRGIGQVGGVAISSALFQYKLDYELRSRIHGDGAAEIVSRIRHSTTLVGGLPLDLQRAARESYAISLRAVFMLAACSTLLAYIARLPIPEKNLDGQPKEIDTQPKSISSEAESGTLPPANGHHAVDNEGNEEARPLLSNRERRFSTL